MIQLSSSIRSESLRDSCARLPLARVTSREKTSNCKGLPILTQMPAPTQTVMVAPGPVASMCVNPGNPVDVPVGMPGETLDEGLCASLGLPYGTTWGANAAQVRNLQMGITSAPMQQQIVSTMPMPMPQNVMVSGKTSLRHFVDHHFPRVFSVRGCSRWMLELTHCMAHRARVISRSSVLRRSGRRLHCICQNGPPRIAQPGH